MPQGPKPTRGTRRRAAAARSTPLVYEPRERFVPLHMRSQRYAIVVAHSARGQDRRLRQRPRLSGPCSAD
jgi:hypothetical protein